MIRIPNIKAPLDTTPAQLKKLAAQALRVRPDEITDVIVSKKSVDARKKNDVCFVLTLDVSVRGKEAQVLARSGLKQAGIAVPYRAPEIVRLPHAPQIRPVVAGTGPAGLFAALALARAGAKPLVLERGAAVEKRTAQVDRFFAGGAFSARTNVQFGEGGAGTFSDGKLTTGIKDPRCAQVLHTFAEHGAPPEILIQQKPHIGTDHLVRIVRSIREEIIALGGEVLFETQLTDVDIENGALRSVRFLRADGTQDEIAADALFLAIGHSARDTFEMLNRRGVPMEQKPFSVGARIEHPQELINRSQYGAFAAHPALGAADYKLNEHLSNGRGVYTFCMCPGGLVVAAASEEGGVVTNGMSLYARDGQNANSALLVSVEPADFGSDHPLAGMLLQRQWERAAFAAGGRNYRAPAQLVGDFLAGRESKAAGAVSPTYRPGVTFGDLRAVLPGFAIDSMREAITLMDRRLHGFALPEAVLTGPETRSSSPVRIPRGADGQSAGVRGLYPTGEGAGYAGGIMSAAVDGLRMADAYLAAVSGR